MTQCPRCGAPRGTGIECPKCGVIYAKAGARRSEAPATAEAAPRSLTFEELQNAQDADVEWKIRVFALPVTLVVVRIIMMSDMLHALARVFLTMWVHELGHAVAAWFTGYGAIPGPWKTLVSENRMWFVTVLLAGFLIAWGVYGVRKKHWLYVAAPAVLLLCQLYGTFRLTLGESRMFFTFFGDGGLVVLGTLLMMTLFASPKSKLHQNWLRWGFLVIGAFAFCDALDTWWGARNDVDKIPFGENEGVGLSDPTVLSQDFGWSTAVMITRYVTLITVCGITLALTYIYFAWRAFQNRPTVDSLPS